MTNSQQDNEEELAAVPLPGTLFVFAPNHMDEYTLTDATSMVFTNSNYNLETGKLNAEHKLSHKTVAVNSGDVCMYMASYTVIQPNDGIVFLYGEHLLGTNSVYWNECFRPVNSTL